MRVIVCPICKNEVLIYEAQGKIYPDLMGRIQRHIEAHKLSEILAYAYDDMANQAIRFEEELSVNQKAIEKEKL